MGIVSNAEVGSGLARSIIFEVHESRLNHERFATPMFVSPGFLGKRLGALR